LITYLVSPAKPPFLAVNPNREHRQSVSDFCKKIENLGNYYSVYQINDKNNLVQPLFQIESGSSHHYIDRVTQVSFQVMPLHPVILLQMTDDRFNTSPTTELILGFCLFVITVGEFTFSGDLHSGNNNPLAPSVSKLGTIDQFCIETGVVEGCIN
jgi:hypothetical protein